MAKRTKAQPSSPPAQVVVILREDAEPLLNGSGSETESLNNTLAGLNLVPLFGDVGADSAGTITSATESTKALPPAVQENRRRMSSFYTLASAPQTDLEKVVSDLNKLGSVEGAYIKPLGEPPIFYEIEQNKEVRAVRKATESGGVPITQDLTNNQTYLNAAPAGIDARYAWTLPGGRGDGVQIIDIEGGWNTGHEDLSVNSGGLISGFNLTTVTAWYQHGTAVFGEMGGDTNTKGVTGICANSRLSAVSVFRTNANDYNSAAAIRFAADQLSVGDVMLLEQHRPGPAAPNDGSQMGFIAIEWGPDDFLAIQYATSKGIIVVEAAGNGSQNLDAAIYDTKPNGFPSWWKNPFRRHPGMDCGAIIVGAGAPASGAFGVARSRLGFSNYGACVDAQGYGAGVTTTGYGEITGTNPSNKNEWYTNNFSGTSSASPIVTGAVASLQGIQKAARRPLLTPARMRQLLRATGTAQQAAPSAPISQRIGTLPNLRQLVQQVAAAPHWCGVQFNGSVAANQTATWFTHSWPDHWQVVWTVVPTAPIIDGNAQIEFKVKVDRQAFGLLKYFIEVKNLTGGPVSVEARFCVLAS